MTNTSEALANLGGSIVLAGAGKMGGAMLAGWLAQGVPPSKIAVIDPMPSDNIKALAAKGVRLNVPATEIGEVAALIVAVKPQMFREAGPQLRPMVRPTTLVVSIMAGMPIATLSGCTVNPGMVRARRNARTLSSRTASRRPFTRSSYGCTSSSYDTAVRWCSRSALNRIS